MWDMHACNPARIFDPGSLGPSTGECAGRPSPRFNTSVLEFGPQRSRAPKPKARGWSSWRVRTAPHPEDGPAPPGELGAGRGRREQASRDHRTHLPPLAGWCALCLLGLHTQLQHTFRRPSNMVRRDTTSKVPIPSMDTTVAVGSRSVSAWRGQYTLCPPALTARAERFRGAFNRQTERQVY